MDRLKVFDRALLGKKIAGNSLIVITDTIYLIAGVFFGSMKVETLYGFILFTNMFVTCVLYHNLIVSRGDMEFELITEKIVYFPTTRIRFLWNKYTKTLIFLLIQETLTLVCLGLGYYGNRGHMDSIRIIGSLVLVYAAILLTSGVSILVMHTMPLGIYLSMLFYVPLYLLEDQYEKIISGKLQMIEGIFPSVFALFIMIALLWLILFWIGNKVYEKINR
jgi:hypothetical protein